MSKSKNIYSTKQSHQHMLWSNLQNDPQHFTFTPSTKTKYKTLPCEKKIKGTKFQSSCISHIVIHFHCLSLFFVFTRYFD